MASVMTLHLRGANMGLNIINENVVSRECFEDLAEIAEHYGTKKQFRQLAEECSELAVEASHSARKGTTVKIIEEIADVLIMIEQVMYLSSISAKDVKELVTYKIKRQKGRIKRGDR